jgi:vancomycin resistance protein YoaR
VLGPLVALLTFGACLGVMLLGYQFYLAGRIVPGVRVLGENVGGMTRVEAQARLGAKLGDPDVLLARLGGQQLVLRDGAQVFRAWPSDLGLRGDFGPALDAALAIGHRGNLALDLFKQARTIWRGADISISAAFDERTARAYLASIEPQIDRPMQEASLQLDGLRVVEVPAEQGRHLDVDETVKRIRARMMNAEGGDVEIAVQETAPPPTDTGIARAQIENFLRAPLLLTFGDREWAIDQATLASLIVLKPVTDPDGSVKITATLNHDALAAQVTALVREINQDPRDARFHFDNGNLIPIVTSQEGRRLDVNATVSQIEGKFAASATAMSRVNGNASPLLDDAPQGRDKGQRASPARSPLQALRDNSLPLTVKIQKPTIDMHDAAKMGIKELVAQGVSNYKHSAAGRIQNIKTATSSFDGVVIPPGGTFSFDQYLIDVVEANGYEDAYVIFGNRTVLGPGGGVCQVSTTMFRAAFWGGFPIVERWAHAYRVGYYEPPVGLDATVFAPDVDLKFLNDTGAYLLIEPVIDEANTTLTFNLYGTKPNREVKMEGPEVTNIKPHGPAIYNDDPSLAKGVVKQVDFAVDGEDVTLYRDIYVDGQLVKHEKFFSRYAPWQAIYQVGTRVQ